MQYQNSRLVSRSVTLALQLGLLGTALVLQAPAVFAGNISSKVKLDIPAQDLANALTQLANQADLQILFSQDLVAGKQTTALSGNFSGGEALQRMLASAGLEFVVNGADTIVIRSSDTPVFRRTQLLTPAPAGESTNAPASAAAPGMLEEIVVTAQKRAERLQDVPVAVTAISADELTQAGIGDTSTITKLAPSLTFTQGNHPSNSSFRVRGVGTAVFGLGLEPSVSVVVDGVVMSRAGQGFTDLADIERVEVLRGPQGTLFGKNAIAGLVNVTTKAPSKEFEGSASATWAQGDEYRINGTLSAPFTDTFRARISGFYNDVGGWVRNVTLGKDVNGQKSSGARTKLQWDATDNLSFLLTNDYRYTDSLCCGSTYARLENTTLQSLIGVPVGGVWSDNNFRYDFEDALTYFHSKQWLHSLEANLKIADSTLTSITAYQAWDFNNNQPIDRLNTPVPINLGSGNGYFDLNGGSVNLHQFSQELRLTSPGGARFNYVTGLYYLDQSVTRGFYRRTGTCASFSTAVQPIGAPCATAVYSSQGGFSATEQTKHAAAFGQADLRLFAGLSTLAGLRVQREDLSYEGVRTDTRLFAGDLPLPGITVPNSGSGKTHDNAITGKAGLKYEFNRESQTYLTWARGYKGGAYGIEFTANFSPTQDPVLPETVTSYELGYKGRLFNDHLMLNTAVFYSEYKNLQVQANRGDPNAGIVNFQTVNAGSATTQGVEVEFTLKPVESFTLSGGVTYLDTSVNIDGLQCPLQFQNAAPALSGKQYNICYKQVTGTTTSAAIQNVQGGVLPMASKWRGNLTARYEQALGSSSLVGFGQLSANSQSKFNFTIEQDPLTRHPGYTLVDASIGAHDPDNRYQVMVFVKNVFDKHYLTSIAHSSALTTSTITPGNLYVTIPKDANRYFGVTISVSF